MEQHQSGDDQSLARSVSMAAEANEAAIAANAALAQMRRNLREIGHLYPVIDDFHERIAIVNRRVEDAISQTERLLTERPSAKVRIASERAEVFTRENGLSNRNSSEWSNFWPEEVGCSDPDACRGEANSDFERLEDDAEL